MYIQIPDLHEDIRCWGQAPRPHAAWYKPHRRASPQLSPRHLPQNPCHPGGVGQEVWNLWAGLCRVHIWIYEYIMCITVYTCVVSCPVCIGAWISADVKCLFFAASAQWKQESWNIVKKKRHPFLDMPCPISFSLQKKHLQIAAIQPPQLWTVGPLWGMVCPAKTTTKTICIFYLWIFFDSLNQLHDSLDACLRIRQAPWSFPVQFFHGKGHRSTCGSSAIQARQRKCQSIQPCPQPCASKNASTSDLWVIISCKKQMAWMLHESLWWNELESKVTNTTQNLSGCSLGLCWLVCVGFRDGEVRWG